MRILIIILLFPSAIKAACFYNVKIKPSQIIDGDTIRDVKFNMDFGITVKRTIRLWGINTPELRGGTKYEKRKAVMASNKLRDIVSRCNSIRAVLHGTDSFGRVLADLYCGNTSISNLLIEQGHAKPFFK